jgi:hypothetical protein
MQLAGHEVKEESSQIFRAPSASHRRVQQPDAAVS